jgi:PAS domain S-box-containing protein
MDYSSTSRPTDAFAASQRKILEAIALGAPINEVLESIIKLVEAQRAGMLCSIILLNDQGRIRHAAGPSLPSEYMRALDGEAIGPEAGSCGTAAYTRQPVIVEDIATHPAWKHYRSLALAYGLRACWSTPIFAPDGPVLGTFAMYYREVRRPDAEDQQWIEAATSLAYVAIASNRLRQSEADRLRMHEAVQYGEHLRSVILDSVDDAIFYMEAGPSGGYRFISVNRGFTELFGVSNAEIAGRWLHEILPDNTREAVLDRYRKAAQTGERQTWDEVMQTRKGEKHGEIKLVPLFDATGTCTNFVGTVHDLTMRVQAERERAQLQLKLSHAHRMRALGTMASGIAHDFNNLLAAIGGNTNLLLSEVPEDTEWRHYLTEIHKATDRAADLVRQILTFGRNSPPDCQIFEPQSVLKEALQLLRSTLPPNVKLDTHISDDAPRIKADATQFHQILVNLLTNAVRALNGNGGVIRLELDRVIHDEQAKTSKTSLRPGEYMRLRVMDNGCGMDASTLKRIFEPFFSTRARGEGTGLGLSVVHGIVQSHAGSIDVTSTPGRGTLVSVYLPASKEEIVPLTSTTAQFGQGQRVMYIDDEDALVLLMDRTLKKMGYRVTGYADPKAALQEFTMNPDAYDVVISDLSMPTMPGTQLAAEMREIRKDIPIILTSGYIRSEDREIAQQLQINEVVYKSSTIEQLADALAGVIKKMNQAQRTS